MATTRDWREALAYVELHNHAGYPHYRAEVRFETATADLRARLQYTLTRRVAAEWNKEEQRGYSKYRYKPGMTVDKFPDREATEQAAVEFFRAYLLGMGARVLIAGSFSTVSAQPIIAVAPGLEEAMSRLNAINTKADQIDRDYRPGQRLEEEDEARINKLWVEWDSQLKAALDRKGE